MRKMWWKVLAVVLMLYSLIAGMIVPLSPAIQTTDFRKANSGEQIEFEVLGYNTRFTENADQLRAWIRLGEYALCMDEVEAIDDRHLRIRSKLPQRLNPVDSAAIFTLVLDAGTDGHPVLPRAVSVVQLPDSAELAPICPIENLTPRAQGMSFPFRSIIEESIRNLYYHVPLWFGMILVFLGSMIYSIRYLMNQQLKEFVYATELIRVGVIFGLLGLITGAIWAKHTWGAYWSWDVKQNTAAISVLIYLAYFVLKDSFEDYDQRARITSVYNIFAFASLIPLLFIIPRVADSLHPGAGGNPAFGSNDLDNTMRLVFYPAVIGFTMLGYWLASILIRIKLLDFRNKELIEE